MCSTTYDLLASKFQLIDHTHVCVLSVACTVSSLANFDGLIAFHVSVRCRTVPIIVLC